MSHWICPESLFSAWPGIPMSSQVGGLTVRLSRFAGRRFGATRVRQQPGLEHLYCDWGNYSPDDSVLSQCHSFVVAW